ncbi:MAG: hypothetical protein ACRDPV_12185 [Gaiellaceae bacterium]
MGVAAAALALLVLAGTGAGSAQDGVRVPAERFTLDEARAFDEYPLYFAGDRVDGQPLVAVGRRSDTAEFVSFIYGDCTPADGVGCAPPIEIQIWPACRRHLALYEVSPAGLAQERTTVRGVAAAILDDGTRLELQTGRATIVVFAGTRARLGRIARDLRSLDPGVARGGALPPPAAGALEGALEC